MSDAIVSPMPGTIVKLAARTGDPVAAGATLLVVEAMKMEHRIEAPRDGVVGAVHVTSGMIVAAGATLMEPEPST